MVVFVFRQEVLASIQPLVFENKLTFPASDKALIRVIHASPDLNSADVSANGTNIATATTFKTATEYLSVTAGAFTLKVTATVTVAPSLFAQLPT